MRKSLRRTSRMQLRPLLMGVIAGALLLGWLVASAAAREGQELIGTPMRSWSELRWLGSPPGDLRGKVVLVDFWTYGCVNCVNTLPHVTQLYSKYRDKGFVVVGVHTPEFPFERSTGNVQAALKRHGITYPVAQDNNSATWNAWRNQYWPAQYIVDQTGRVVYSHAGEGAYDEIDRTVAKLLNAQS